jgi:plasmid stabilization system protein ParE
MSFVVNWSRRAEDELADLWVNAQDRNAVTAAANEIERLLARDPLGVGESRVRGQRILFAPPLGALYHVDSRRRVVKVITVALSGRP